MFDYHMHTCASFDCSASLKEMALAASRMGLTEICVTDHIDFDPCAPDSSELIFDLSDALFAYTSVKESIPGLTIKFGAEISAPPEHTAFFSRYATQFAYDFILCSVHFVGVEDPYFPTYFAHKTEREAYERYLKEVLLCVKAHNHFNVLGHLTYVLKYTPFKNSLLRYADYNDLIDEILRTVIAKGKGIEVNTSGISRIGVPLPDMTIVKRYLELGGEILTIGSDAHRADCVGDHVATTITCLKETGVKYLCTFDRQKPIFHNI